MEEKRRNKRIPISMQLEISTLFKQDNVKVGSVDAPIDVVNISRTGIAFKTESMLPIGYYFNSKIQIGDKDSKFYCVVRIIRREKLDDSLSLYGCEFIGFAPVLNYVFDELESVQE